MNRSTQEWVDYFRWNGSVAMRVPWHIGPDLSDAERAAIAHSIQMFQLGEHSEGRHLMRYAKEWADRTGDAAYPEAIRMLIVEEQRHASVLGRFMEINRNRAYQARLLRWSLLVGAKSFRQSRGLDQRPRHRRDYRQDLLSSTGRGDRIRRPSRDLRSDSSRGDRTRGVPNRATGTYSSRTPGVRHLGCALFSPPALLSDPHSSWSVASNRVAPRRPTT